MDKKSAKGVWKTNWQDLTGLCYSSPNHSLSTELKLRFTDYINSKSDGNFFISYFLALLFFYFYFIFVFINFIWFFIILFFNIIYRRYSTCQ